MKKLTIKEKNILLKDLCTRLPYGVIIEYNNDGCLFTRELGLGSLHDFMFDNAELKPYLRPMSSMNEKEKQEFSIFTGKTEVYVQQICLDADSMANPIIGGNKCVYWGLFDKCIDWLNEHYFDYRGLIGKGLAIEAPEGMYK